MPPLRTLILAALVVLTAGYMVVDGARALLVGDYFTVEGELGPWAALVAALGVDPRSTGMKVAFVAYGLAWLAALATHLAGRAPRGVMVGFAVGALAYLVIGTVFAVAQLGVLLWPGRDRPRPPATRA